MTLGSFNAYINDTKLSYATQRSFPLSDLFFMIQQFLYADSQLRSTGLRFYSPCINPILKPFQDLMHLHLTTEVLDNDKFKVEDLIAKWISNNSIGKYEYDEFFFLSNEFNSR